MIEQELSRLVANFSLPHLRPANAFFLFFEVCADVSIFDSFSAAESYSGDSSPIYQLNSLQ